MQNIFQRLKNWKLARPSDTVRVGKSIPIKQAYFTCFVGMDPPTFI